MRDLSQQWPAALPVAEHAGYRRRDPEASVLHAVMRENLEPLLARLEEEGRPLPSFVVRELRAYVRCGVLSRGFARFRCPACGKSLLVGLSCGGRTVCPSCSGRRMAQTAANLVDHVLPRRAPYRQWVLTLPFSLRFLVAFDHDLEQEVLRVFIRSVSAWYRARGREQGAADPKVAGVVVKQRWQDDLGLNPHWHALFVDGTYDAPGASPPELVESRPPSDDDVAEVVARVARWVGRALARRGLDDEAGVDDAVREVAEEEPALASLASASLRGTYALDGPWARRVQRLCTARAQGRRRRGRLCAEVEGFNLHAATYVGEGRTTRLEQLCRYLTRPPLSDKRLTLLDDGSVALRLRHPRRDGTVAVVLPPDELICRLAALVPRPFKNGIVYFGCLAGNASLRAEIVPGGRRHPQGGGRACKRIPWRDLSIRTLGVDPLLCGCGERYELIAEIHDRVVIRAILASMNLPTDPLPIRPARPPPDEDAFDWAA